MNGEIGLDEVYGKRLEIIRPTLARVEQLGELYRASLVTGADETIRALVERGVTVHLVTAGISQAIFPLARHLGIEERLVHSVALRFAANGEYEDFDRRS